MSEACQNAAHQQLPPPPFYGFQNLSSSTIFKRNKLSRTLLVTTRPDLHNNYVLMYATLANLLCWIVFYSLWNKVARSCFAARAVQIVWFSHDALRQSLQDEEARSSDADVELPFFPLEAPEELQARRIDQWLRNEDMPGPRQRPKRQGPTVFESNSNTIPGGTWQERLEGRDVTI